VVHHPAGTGRAFNLEVVAVVEVEVQERPDKYGIDRHPDRTPPVGVAAEHVGVRLCGQIIHTVLLAARVEDRKSPSGSIRNTFLHFPDYFHP
jgi:hypothetical protein